MNEASWLAAGDPIPMLDFLNAGLALPGVSLASPRKLRLFACACARHAWRRVTAAACRKAVEVAEAYADGLATRDDLDRAWSQSLAPPRTAVNVAAGLIAIAGSLPERLPGILAKLVDSDYGARAVIVAGHAALLRDVFGNPSRPVELRHLGNALCRRCSGAGTRPDVYPPTPCPACSCVTPVALSVARRAYDERDFAAFPVLADALEEAGCEEAALLRHLRGQDRCGRCLGRGVEVLDLDPMSVVLGGLSPRDICRGCGGSGWVAAGPHVRGCWALDLVLGKS